MGKRFTVFTLAFFLLCMLLGGCDDAASLRWTRQFAPTGEEDWTYVEGGDLAVDGNGNSYMTGVTMGSMDDQVLKGITGAYIVKYDRAGQKKWTRLLDTEGADVFGNGVAFDGNGNVYITGIANGGLDNEGPFGNTDLFIAKYSSDGKKQWTKLIGSGNCDTAGISIAVDDKGSIYVAGFTNANTDGSGPNDTMHVFLSKFNSAGAAIWTHPVGDASEITMVMKMALDPAGNCYVTGSTEGSIGGQMATSTSAFAVKINPAGAMVWAKLIAADGAAAMGSGIAVDSAGNCYVTGTAYGPLNGKTLNGYSDAFLVKYGPLGAKKWTRMLGAPEVDAGGFSVAIDLSGNCFLAGATSGSLDGQAFKGLCDAFVAKYTSSGARKWTLLMGAEGDVTTESRDIAVDDSGTAYLFGITNGSLDGVSPSGSISMFLTTMLNE